MSVFVKGMMMPRNCRECPLSHDASCYAGEIPKPDDGNGLSRRDGCPLVEVLDVYYVLDEFSKPVKFILEEDVL